MDLLLFTTASAWLVDDGNDRDYSFFSLSSAYYPGIIINIVAKQQLIPGRVQGSL